MVTRRNFIKNIYMLISLILLLKKRALASNTLKNNNHKTNINSRRDRSNINYGVQSDGFSYVYGASGGSPENNMRKVIEMLGGIERFVDPTDIVILKPNAQWWNQGMTNTDAIKAFIELVLARPGFNGEIIIAENHHKKGLNSRGWTTDDKNGNYNYNELIEYFVSRGYDNVSKYHWKDAGRNPRPLEGDDGGGVRVNGPHEGEGYVWRDDIQYVAPNGNVCWMTYPVFKSSYSGRMIDLKDGVWQNGAYLKDPKIKFINFAAINHHGFYSGVTGSVKNLMGVVDMTCGLQAPQPENTFNVHFVGVEPIVKYTWYTKKRWKLGFLKDMLKKLAYTHFECTGGALGKFMTSIRMPDLNIITAEWVGWGSRTDKSKSAHTKSVVASSDPVALDYIAARDVLLSATPKEQSSYRQLNNPGNTDGPFFKFLSECYYQGVGNLDQNKIKKDWHYFTNS
jgi:uncharacterized protein (DUF362 family)